MGELEGKERHSGVRGWGSKRSRRGKRGAKRGAEIRTKCYQRKWWGGITQKKGWQSRCRR